MIDLVEAAEGDASTVTLLDLYEPHELIDTSEMLHNFLNNKEEWSIPLPVKIMTPDAAKKVRQAGSDLTVMGSFTKNASKAQRALVKSKIERYDENRIIVLCHDAVVDGMHHLVAAVKAGRSLRYVDLADLG